MNLHSISYTPDPLSPGVEKRQEGLAAHQISIPFGAELSAVRQHRLQLEIEARRGPRSIPRPRYTKEFLMQQAASRYFDLLTQAQNGLMGSFNETDFSLLLNAMPNPAWSFSPEYPLAAMLIDACGLLDIEGLDDIADPGMRNLVRRLSNLSSLEQVAVIDACERVWRGYGNPLV